MNDLNVLLAGFGGQGIQFMGKVLAYAGLIDKKEVSYIPSYGPEMRGGTSNCSVCISQDPICSPLVTEPNALIVMNLPSFDKFVPATVSGGKIFVESTLIEKKVDRDDVEVYYIPAKDLAEENSLQGLDSMIILGKLIKETGCFSMDVLKKTIEKVVPARKQHLVPKNLEALELGMNYKG